MRDPRLGVGDDAGQRSQMPGEDQAQLLEATGSLAAQDLDRLPDLERVADELTERLVHVGDQGRARPAGIAADGDAQLGESAGGVDLAHERARARLHVEQDVLRSAGQLLAHDAGGDQGRVLDGRGDVAQRVHPPVGGVQGVGLGADREADRPGLADQLGHRQLGSHPGDRVELVQGAAGVAEPAPRQLQHLHPERRREWRDDQRRAVAHPSGGVFVDGRPRQPGEVDRLSGVDHRRGEDSGLPRGEAADPARHEERRHLVVRQLLTRVTEHQFAQRAGVDLAAVAFGGDHLGHRHRRPARHDASAYIRPLHLEPLC